MNLVAVALLALALGRRRRALGLLTAAIGIGLVALRGYVVPFTPQFAPALVARSPLPDEWFHDAPDPVREGTAGIEGTDAPDGEAVLEELVAAGVVTADEVSVGLAPDFETRWHEEMDDLAALDTDALADAVFEVAHAAEVSVFVEETLVGEDDEWVVLSDGSGEFDGDTWLSRPVAIADTAAVRALDGRFDDATRRAAAGALRTFLAACPDCGADLVEKSAAGCCGGYTNPTEEPPTVLACQDCDVRLFTFED